MIPVMTQVARTFTCFGGPCTIAIDGEGPLGDPLGTLETVRDHLLDWHAVFSRFKPESELSALNRDPHEIVQVSPIMARFVQAVVDAAQATEGLVDATLLDQIEEAGYRGDHMRASMSLPLALALTVGRQNGGPRSNGRWREISVDVASGKVRRPPGLRFDGGGIVKGLCADWVAELLGEYRSYAIDCDGDLRIGGAGGVERSIEVPNPFKGPVLHQFVMSEGAVSTSSIEKCSWMGEGMKPAHHLIDPASGRPAYTGVVQVTALGSTALESEMLAKAAVLSGPDGAVRWLQQGGFIILDDGSHGEVKAA